MSALNLQAQPVTRSRCGRCFSAYKVHLAPDGELRCEPCLRGQARCLYCFVLLKGRATTGAGIYCSDLCEARGQLRDRGLERQIRQHNFTVQPIRGQRYA